MTTEALTMDTNVANDLISRFREDCDLRGLVSTRNYVSGAFEYSNFLNMRGKGVFSADKEDLKAFLIHLRKRGIKQTTIEVMFVRLSAFYTFMIDEGNTENNPILPFRKRYLHKFKDESDAEMRKIISVAEASTLVNSILDSRDKAIVVLLLKTGMRRKELCSLDISDVDLKQGIIKLKPTPKRSNRTLFIDEEATSVLQKWIQARKTRKGANGPALFISIRGTRLCPMQVERMIRKQATIVGLHDPDSDKLEDHFGPHCCRHWFTTHLIRAGMPRDFVKELRGDARHDAIDIYNHIDKKELRESYLAHIPQLGI
ncbi:MAG: tyrosine-type recombinase/integrase [Methanotrichaceae archaeon]|jgi:integrase/recombinase XerD